MKGRKYMLINRCTYSRTIGVLITIGCLTIHLQAQPDTAAPPSGNLSDAMKSVLARALDLLIVLRDQIQAPLLPYFEAIAGGLALIMIIAGFARMWRENGGAGVDLYWWFGRVAVCMIMFTNGPSILQYMATFGSSVAYNDGNSPLFIFYKTQQDNFDTAYKQFVDHNFKVNIEGNDTLIIPGSGSMGATEVTPANLNIPKVVNEFQTNLNDLPTLYKYLNFGQGVLTFGDMFLTLLMPAIYIIMTLISPFVIALALDRNIASRVSYPFLWGAIVLTLVWPTVATVISGVAYAGGNLAMALGNTNAIYNLDTETLSVIQDPNFYPTYTILIAVMIMFGAGLCLWASPYIAYQISMGTVYETMQSTMSQLTDNLKSYGFWHVGVGNLEKNFPQLQTNRGQGQSGNPSIDHAERPDMMYDNRSNGIRSKANKIQRLNQSNIDTVIPTVTPTMRDKANLTSEYEKSYVDVGRPQNDQRK